MNEFKQALGFLTRIPPGRNFRHEADLAGPAVAWYGPVGALIGVILVVLAIFVTSLLNIHPAVCAGLVIAAWIGITGALHLDGLGDCADGLMGGFSRERIMEIMADTDSGVGAISAIVVILGIKLVSLSLLFEQAQFLAVLFAPVLARITLTVAIARFPYVRADGLGSTIHDTLDLRLITLYGAGLVLILAVISPQALVAGVIGCALAFALVWVLVVRKIRGFTGDVYGALVEVCECAVVVSLTTLL
jgi:adenosylcobinamide-GDP ribazoletransferase